MSVAFIVHSLDRFAGGIENRVSELEMNLPDFERDIIIFKNVVNLPHKGNIKKIPLIKIPPIFLKKKNVFSCMIGLYVFFRRLFFLRKLFKSNKYRVIVAFDDYFGLMSLLATYNLNIKVIVSVRNCWSIMYSKKKCVHLLPTFFYKKLYPWLIRNKNCLVHTVSFCLEKEIISKYKINNVKTIYNLFDFNKIKTLSQENISFNFEYIINIGHLNEQKNHIDLIETYFILKQQYNIKEKLVIIGEGKQRKIIEEKINFFNLQNDVFLVGKQKNPYKFLKRAKVFVSTSLYEGLPSVFIESHILNVPIVSYDFKCGARELSCFVTKSNPYDLARKVFEVLNNKDLQKKSIDFGKNIITTRLNRESILNKWKEILDV